MYDVDYSKWVEYIEQIFKKLNKTPKLIADLGCGTGNVCIEMAKKNYEMIGIDISENMLSCAQNKAYDNAVDILFLNQDMTQFELHGTVDAVLCLMDSVNYILNKNNLLKMFKLVKNYLNTGGVFIFDINTAYKLKTILSDNIFYDVGEDCSYIWKNSYNKKTHISEFDLTFFKKEENKESYIRADEIHQERAYEDSEIKEIIKKSGLKFINIYHELTFSKPKSKSERVFFVCSK